MNRNRNGNDAAARNDTAVNQDVTVNVGGSGKDAGGSDCYQRGLCQKCMRSPERCAIAEKHGIEQMQDTYLENCHGG